MNFEDEQFNIDNGPVKVVSKERIRPRFLGDGLDEPDTIHQAIVIEDDAGSLDACFNDLEESQLPAPLNHEEIEANLVAAKNLESIDPFKINKIEEEESQPKKIIKRRNLVKIDENRLFDSKIGIPKLMKICKDFKTSGKGKEKEDLKRLLKMYRIWTHSMYPKGTFNDSIESIEKICRKTKMKIALQKWREEFSESTGKKPPGSKQVKNPIAPINPITLENDVDKSRDDIVLHDPPTRVNLNLNPAESSNTRPSVEQPLFLPADESDDEFPMEDDINAILDNLIT